MSIDQLASLDWLKSSIERAVPNQETTNILTEIIEVCHQTSRQQPQPIIEDNDWPSLGMRKDDRLWKRVVKGLHDLCSNNGIECPQDQDIVKFGGQLGAPGLISLHYAPTSSSKDHGSVLGPTNSCIRLLVDKLGLDIASPESSLLCWMDRVFIKVPDSARSQNILRPYEFVLVERAEMTQVLENADNTCSLLCSLLGNDAMRPSTILGSAL